MLPTIDCWLEQLNTSNEIGLYIDEQHTNLHQGLSLIEGVLNGSGCAYDKLIRGLNEYIGFDDVEMDAVVGMFFCQTLGSNVRVEDSSDQSAVYPIFRINLINSRKYMVNAIFTGSEVILIDDVLYEDIETVPLIFSNLDLYHKIGPTVYGTNSPIFTIKEQSCRFGLPDKEANPLLFEFAEYDFGRGFEHPWCENAVELAHFFYAFLEDEPIATRYFDSLFESFNQNALNGNSAALI